MGKKRPKTVRKMISMPRELMQRMDKVAEEVNWSALARQAFREKLAEIDLRKKETTVMSSVVERMRAAKRKSDSEEFQSGFESGKDWASRRGEPAELERLESLWEINLASGDYGWEWWFSHGDTESTYSEWMEVLYPGDEPDMEAMFGAYFDVVPSCGPSGEFLRGFSEGALEVWWEAKPQL